MKTVVIVQARMGSARLPGKVLMDIAGQPMLARVMHRVRQASTPDEVVVATTAESRDDELISVCNQKGWPCFRGSQQDVLDRYYQTASLLQADLVVRITSDCPLIDPSIIDQVVTAFDESGASVDYAANVLQPRTYPRGLDVEVFTFEALRRAWNATDDASCREHVTPWIYRNADQFNLLAITHETDQSHRRWTVDTPEDLEFVRTVFSHFGHNDFTWHEVLAASDQHPEWSRINSHVQQKAA